jgi:ferrochelatase
VVLVPVAFVSEHLETLYDLDVLGRQAAEAAGAIQVVRAAAQGPRAELIAALAALVRQVSRAELAA